MNENDNRTLARELEAEARTVDFDPRMVERAAQRARARRRYRRASGAVLVAAAVGAIAIPTALNQRGVEPDVASGAQVTPGGEQVTPGLMMMTSPSDLPARGGLASGTLTQDAQGCVALMLPSDVIQPVVWPNGWTAHLEDGEVVLYDSAGEVVAHEGDLLAIGGGLVGPDHEFNQHACATSEPWTTDADAVTVGTVP